jgi:hypothetical protein
MRTVFEELVAKSVAKDTRAESTREREVRLHRNHTVTRAVAETDRRIDRRISECDMAKADEFREYLETIAQAMLYAGGYGVYAQAIDKSSKVEFLENCPSLPKRDSLHKINNR